MSTFYAVKVSDPEVIRIPMCVAVVWNPWQEKAASMSDLAPMEYLEMLCVEAGAVTTPTSLPPGQQATFSQRLIICRGSNVKL